MNRSSRDGEDHGAQALSPVGAAKPPLTSYRRNLPHLQRDGNTLFVTFNTKDRRILPASVRSIVMDHSLHDHGVKHSMHAAVVMPDHVHLLFTPHRDANGVTYGFAEIMRGIKGASARSVNRALGTSGTLWQSESFDRILRSHENARAVAEYICANPVRAGLVENEDAYP